MPIPRPGPYIWVTWLSRLLVGDNSCEWASWFKTHHEKYARMPSTFDSTTWQMQHTALLNEVRSRLESEGKTVFTENQNLFRLRGSSGAVLGGKPDLVALSGEQGTIYDVKTGQPRASDHVQVMVYMYALPHAFRQYRGLPFDGAVVYQDHTVPIPSTAVNEAFKDNLATLIRRLASQTQARKVPSAMECGFCEITSADCPERIDGETGADVPEVADF